MFYLKKVFVKIYLIYTKQNDFNKYSKYIIFAASPFLITVQ